MEGLEKDEMGLAIIEARKLESEAAKRVVDDIQADQAEQERLRDEAIQKAADAAAAAIDWGVPALVGRDEPLPVEIPMTRDGARKATFYLRRAWDVLFMIEMEEAGVPSDINLQLGGARTKEAMIEFNKRVVAQNRHAAARLLDEAHAWDPFERDDGTTWTYRPPAPDEVGTSKDDRVRLACGLLRQFGNLKSKAFMLGMGIREVVEGNSEPSSAPGESTALLPSVPETPLPS